ncbi:MAG: hypothetical protein ACKOET_11695, partial [Verrucomicrobiota bacterium]
MPTPWLMPRRRRFLPLPPFLTVLLCLAAGPALAQPRRPASEAARREWLENMVVHHGYGLEEIRAATGLGADEVAADLKRYAFPAGPSAVAPGAPLRVLPYPGGRHPRLGFLDGAVD